MMDVICILHTVIKLYNQWLFLVPLKGGRWHIIPQLAVYTTYILPSGGLYATYHLLGEPETTIDIKVDIFGTKKGQQCNMLLATCKTCFCHMKGGKSILTRFYTQNPNEPRKKKTALLFMKYWVV